MGEFLLPLLKGETMTAASIIEQYNSERPNSVDTDQKLSLLLKCEKTVADVIIRRHKGGPTDEDLDLHLNIFDLNSDMLVPEPYDDLYIYYLDQRIALNQNDTRRYNAAATLYNNAFLAYQQKYNREHLPISERKHMIRHEDI